MNPKWKHGGNVYEIERQYGISHRSIIDFSANINPLGYPESLKPAITDALEDLVHYPDPGYSDLVQAIATARSLSNDWIFPGNGAIESLYLVAEYLRAPKVHIMAPSFVEYERSFRRYGSEIHWVLLKEENQFQLTEADLADALGKPGEPIILCTPNNPTGSLVAPELMKKIIETTKACNQPLILDEAFMEFIGDEDVRSMIGHVESHPNLFILRSMTKCYAIPGLRLGYLITSNPDFRAWIQEYRIPWMINHLAACAGVAALQDREHLPKTRVYVTEQREFLQHRIQSIPQLTQYPASANYLCFRLNDPSVSLREELIKRGILIRSCSNYIGLDERYFRIAVRNEADNQSLIRALQDIF